MVDLSRFLQAQENSYDTALAEIKSGRKQSHWMWFNFPQLKGLGRSSTAEYYAIQNIDEARAYLQHPVLGRRLIQISEALLKLPHSDLTRILGTPDDLKLRSSMTLFAVADPTAEVFSMVLSKFFADERDERTLHLLNV